MEQEVDIDSLVRRKIRALRLARGWSLDALAERTFLSPSNLSRIETGSRRIALDQLVPIAQALDVTLDQLIESSADADVVIRPQRVEQLGTTIWSLARERNPFEMSIAKMRFSAPISDAEQLGVHPGRDWFVVLTGIAELRLGERTVLVEAGNAAEFSTMIPHAIGAHDGPVEILTILTSDGEKAHLHQGPPGARAKN